MQIILHFDINSRGIALRVGQFASEAEKVYCSQILNNDYMLSRLLLFNSIQSHVLSEFDWINTTQWFDIEAGHYFQYENECPPRFEIIVFCSSYRQGFGKCSLHL